MDNDTYADAGYDTAPTTNRTRTDRRERDRPATDRRTANPNSGERTPVSKTNRRTASRDADRVTMGDVSHTNPHTGESFGDTVTFRRGTTVVADGGTAGAVPEPDDEDDENDADGTDGERATGEGAEAERADVEAEKVVPASGGTMGDVSHEPPHDAPDPNAVYMRGGEGATDEDADDEEPEE